MGEADSALREEIEKVREKARLQAEAQGLGPDAAAELGNAAVEEFCARWGIRPEMVAPGVLRGAVPGPTTGQPLREEVRKKADLGSSPMRGNTNPGSTQAIRISDLLKRAKESEAALYTPSPKPVGAGTPPSPAATTRSGSKLSSLLQRMRSPGTPVPPTPAAPASRLSYAPHPPSPRATVPGSGLPQRPGAPGPAPGAAQGSVSRNETLGGGGSPSANAEVQAMLEQCIGVVDIALNDASKGISGVMALATAGGLAPEEMTVLANDVDRLRRHLHDMTGLCEEFLQHMNQINASRSGGG